MINFIDKNNCQVIFCVRKINSSLFIYVSYLGRVHFILLQFGLRKNSKLDLMIKIKHFTSMIISKSEIIKLDIKFNKNRGNLFKTQTLCE